jgi:hypothetical protein
MWLSVGQRVALVVKNTGSVLGTSTVTSITDSTGTTAGFTLASALSIVNTTVYVVVNMATDDTTGVNANKNGAYLNDPMGIGGIVDDSDPPTGDFQGVDSDVAANNWHRATVYPASGSSGGAAVSLTEALLDASYAASIEIGGRVPTLGLASFGMVRAYANLVRTNRRYVNTMTFDAGIGGLEFNATPIIADRDCRKNVLYWLDEEDLQVEVMVEPQWLNRDNLIWRMASNDTDSVWAAFYCRETMSTRTRHVHTILTQVIQPA